jgi:hypothetical protein
MQVPPTTYEYIAQLVPATGRGLAIVNRLGAEGWRINQVLPLHANIGETLGSGDEQMIVLFERVTHDGYEHLVAALEAMFERITVATAQD